MALWLIRAGKDGHDEAAALEKGMAIIGFLEVPDLSSVDSREKMRAICEEVYTKESKNCVANFIGQLWAFVGRASVGDMVALPLKTRSGVALGIIKSNYKYEEGRHTRKVKWVRTDVPRTEFGQDLLYSLGAFLTVCQISRNDAETRVAAIMEGKKDPNFRAQPPDSARDDAQEDGTIPIDIEEHALDQIQMAIETKFKGHELTRLINAILSARGYFTYTSPPGPDGGIDILAGQGAMGFDQPKLCVQVKSGSSVGDAAIRELEGAMGRVGADQGLFVSWGGFKDSAMKEVSRLFFKVRLWDSQRLVQALLGCYEELPDDIQAELPLKRVWALVPEE